MRCRVWPSGMKRVPNPPPVWTQEQGRDAGDVFVLRERLPCPPWTRSVVGSEWVRFGTELLRLRTLHPSPARSPQLKTQMWQLLKGHDHLQEEFSVFFDHLRPAASRMGDFEEINWTEEKEYEVPALRLQWGGGGHVPGGACPGLR